MKKILMASLFGVAAMFSQGWADPCLANGQKVFCQWNANGCWQVNSTPDTGPQSTCETQAGYCPALFSGGREGAGACGSFGNSPFTMCSGCWTEEVGLVWCDFGGPSEYGDGGCFRKTAADCAADQGTPVASCPGTTNPTTCPTGTTGTPPNCTSIIGSTECPTGYTGTYPYCTPPGTQPIITTYKGPASGNALAAMNNAVSLQVMKAGTFSIYDMKGNALRVQKVEQGSHVVQLQLPRGLYVIKATSGSWQQTVKVTVK